MAKVIKLQVDHNEVCPGEAATVVATTDPAGSGVEWFANDRRVAEPSEILIVNGFGSLVQFSQQGQTLVIEARKDGTSRSVRVTSKIADAKVELEPRVVDGIYMITGEPRMPAITARAVGVGGPISGLHWNNWIIDNENVILECTPPGPPGLAGNLEFPATDGGEQVTLNTNTLIRGGAVDISFTGTINGCQVFDAGFGNIHGTNPQRSDVQAALPHDTLRRIACRESGQRQFNAPPDGGTSRCPLFGPGGKVGVMQVANPNHDDVWNWRANIQKGVTIFNNGVDAVRNYPGRIRNSAKLKNLVDVYNQHRQSGGLPAIAVTLPD